MVNVTISVSSELKALLARHPEINWSEVARNAWLSKAQQLELLNVITAKSKASDKDVEELAALIKQGVAEWHEDVLHGTGRGYKRGRVGNPAKRVGKRPAARPEA